MKCPKCLSDNPDGGRFCADCGTKLDTGDTRPDATETLRMPVLDLTTGSVFAGRYQIIEELGHGGMGRVYRALDKTLDEEVALKLVRPEIAADQATVERFHAELRLARKISHPHVGRVYELMEHNGTHFITMEYVPGQDLRGLIRQAGQLTVGKAIMIAKEVCDGLEEAHRQGVVHRDLKPSNIIIDRAGNARIIDFGIARSIAVRGRTRAGAMIGTPEYMSPEQVEGTDVDMRSDIYSLGVVLYEMLTGRVPFEGDTALAVALKQKNETPADPRTLNPNIPSGLGAIILKCLEKDKAKRFTAAAEVRAGLGPIEDGLPRTERAISQRRPLTSKEITLTFRLAKLLVPALAVIALIVAAIIFWPKKALTLDPGLVAVAVFENKTGDPKYDILGSKAAERIIQGLNQVGQFSVAPLLSDESAQAKSKSRDRLRALAEATEAGKIIHGDYYLQGETIQFHAWARDMTTRKNPYLFNLEPVSGPAADPDPALESLRLKLMGGLAGLFDPELREYLMTLAVVPNLEACRGYIEGLRAFSRYQYESATEHFLLAWEHDPKFNAALMYAAISYRNLGKFAEAEEQIKKIEKSRADLAPGERDLLECLQAYIREDNDTYFRLVRQIAIRSKTQLSIFALAQAACWNNCPREAKTVLSEYDPYLPARKDWSPSYWAVLTTAHHMLRNHRKELKEARRGRRQFPENLRLLDTEVLALAALGRMKDIQELFEESKSLPPQRGYSPGSIMLAAGKELRAHGFREDSIRILNQALSWFENRPEEEKAELNSRDERAQVLLGLGRLDEAEKLFQGLREDAPERYDYSAALGTIAARQGRDDQAKKIFNELEQNKAPHLSGGPAYWRARIAAIFGDKEEAVKLLRQAIKESFAINYYERIHVTEDFESLAAYPAFIQLMKPKG